MIKLDANMFLVNLDDCRNNTKFSIRGFEVGEDYHVLGFFGEDFYLRKMECKKRNEYILSFSEDFDDSEARKIITYDELMNKIKNSVYYNGDDTFLFYMNTLKMRLNNLGKRFKVAFDRYLNNDPEQKGLRRYMDSMLMFINNMWIIEEDRAISKEEIKEHFFMIDYNSSNEFVSFANDYLYSKAIKIDGFDILTRYYYETDHESLINTTFINILNIDMSELLHEGEMLTYLDNNNIKTLGDLFNHEDLLNELYDKYYFFRDYIKDYINNYIDRYVKYSFTPSEDRELNFSTLKPFIKLIKLERIKRILLMKDDEFNKLFSDFEEEVVINHNSEHLKAFNDLFNKLYKIKGISSASYKEIIVIKCLSEYELKLMYYFLKALGIKIVSKNREFTSRMVDIAKDEDGSFVACSDLWAPLALNYYKRKPNCICICSFEYELSEPLKSIFKQVAENIKRGGD